MSSLLVNVYLDHCLDRPWRKRQREAPLLRTADDILILAHSPAQAERLYRDLAQRLTSAGVPLKGTRDTAIQDLARGGQAQWLGFCVGMEAGEVRVDLAERSWRKLAQSLELAHEKPLSARAAEQLVAGWLFQAAPVHRHMPIRELVERVRLLSPGLWL